MFRGKWASESIIAKIVMFAKCAATTGAVSVLIASPANAAKKTENNPGDMRIPKLKTKSSKLDFFS
jgi:hypothetical protein